MTGKQIAPIAAIEATPSYPALELDVSLYQDMMDDPSIPDDQKQELLETLWAIAVACVDMGLGLHPLQQACGQFELYSEVPNMAPSDVIDCSHTAKFEFDAAKPAGSSDSEFGKAEKPGKEEKHHDATI